MNTNVAFIKSSPALRVVERPAISIVKFEKKQIDLAEHLKSTKYVEQAETVERAERADATEGLFEIKDAVREIKELVVQLTSLNKDFLARTETAFL